MLCKAKDFQALSLLVVLGCSSVLCRVFIRFSIFDPLSTTAMESERTKNFTEDAYRYGSIESVESSRAPSWRHDVMSCHQLGSIVSYRPYSYDLPG
jgi:hypothetical protein